MINDVAFTLSATVDFPDDVRYGPYSAHLLDELMVRLTAMGVRRVYWLYYGETDPKSPWAGNLYSRMEYGDETISVLGEPLRAAVPVAHAHGLEIFGVLKPYNTGLSWSVPEGDPGAAHLPGPRRIGGVVTQAIPFIQARPNLRVRRGEVPAVDPAGVVERIRLLKADASPTRLGGEDLEIWTSDDNYRYRPLEQPLSVAASIEAAPRDVYDYYGNLVTSAGDPVRTLTIDGLGLSDRYIAVTTRFRDREGDFSNTALGMIEAYDAEGVLLPIVVATRSAMGVSPRDPSSYGLEFDSGFGPQMTTLDTGWEATRTPADPGGWWREMTTGGVVAFARGKNEFLPTTPCEAYPEVREIWDGWVERLIATGVDGIDIRVSHHGSLVDEPHAYGFDPPVIEDFERIHGRSPTRDPEDLAEIARLRGSQFTAFVRDTSRRVRAAGRRMQAHVHLEAFRPEVCHGQMMGIPANVEFDWRSWLREGLLDGVTLRSSWFEALEDPEPGRTDRSSLARVISDPLTEEALELCEALGVPVYLNRYIDRAAGIEEYLSDLEVTCRDPRFAGFDLYETAHVARPYPDGSALEPYRDRPRLLAEKAAELGLI